MKHIVTLKNNKTIELEWNFLVIDYLDDYPGGYEQLMKDYKSNKNKLKINSHFIYACIAANMDEPMEYRNVLKLVDLKSYKTILNFVEENKNQFEDFKKKDRAYFTKKKSKRKN